MESCLQRISYLFSFSGFLHDQAWISPEEEEEEEEEEERTQYSDKICCSICHINHKQIGPFLWRQYLFVAQSFFLTI